jgi:hypothetical protein
MANESLDQRLSQIVPEAAEQNQLPADLPRADVELANAGDDNTIQVAGLSDKIIKGLTRAAEVVTDFGGPATSKVEKAAAEKKLLQETEKIITPSPTPAVTPAPIPATPKPRKAKAAPTPAAKLEELPKQLEVFEAKIETAPVTGKPPETLINVERIDGVDDFKQTVNALSDASGIKVDKMTWEQTLAAAKEKGFGSDILGDLQSMKEQYGDIPVDMVRLRLASYQSSKDFYDLARQAYLNPDDTVLQAKLLRQLSLHGAVNDAYVLSRTRAAQATSVGRMQITEGKAAGIMDKAGNVKIPSINDAEMKKMLADPNVSDNLKLMVSKFVQLNDEGAREGLINKVGKVGLIADLWDRTWKNGLLSATGTHIVNFASNTTMLASTVATRAIAGGIGISKRAVGGTGEVELSEAGALLSGMIHGFRDGMSLSWQALKTGTTREQRAGQNLLDDAGMKLEGQYNIFDARDYGLEREWLIKGINYYANFGSLLGGRPIMAMDEFFKTIGYRAELTAQSYRAGAQARRDAIASGKTAEEAVQIELKVMGDTLANPPANIDEAASDFSQMITFSKKLTGVSKQIQELAQDHLIGRISLPFVKTPIWVSSESLQHSGLAFISSQWRKDMAAGGAQRELAMAKFGMGSMLMIGVGSYVADGRITGGGPGDTNLRKIYLDSGWKPYSFVFQPGEWDAEFVDYLKTMRIDPSIGKDQRLYVPFRGIDPLAGPLAMMADAVEYARYEDDEDLVAQVVLGATWGLYSYVGQQPYLTAISSIAGAFSQSIPNPKQAFKDGLNQIASTGSQYAIEGSPVGLFNSARAQVERIVDPNKRETAESPNTPTVIKGFYEGLNRSISKTPFLSDSLGKQYDYLGEEMMDIDPANPWLASSSGVRFSTSKQRPADKIMIELGMSIKKPNRAVTVGNVSVKLEPDEYEYMMRQFGKITDGQGLRLKDAIVERTKSPGFEDMDKYVRQQNIAEVYSSFTEAAKQDLIANSKFSTAIQRRIETAQNRLPRVGKYAK